MIVCYAGRLSRSTCKEGQRHGKLSSILSLPWSAKADRIGRSEVPRLLKDLLSQQRSGASQVRLHDFLEQDDLLFLLHAQEQNVPYSMTTRMNMMRAFLAPSSSNSHPTQEPLQYLAGQGNIIQQSKANVFFFFFGKGVNARSNQQAANIGIPLKASLASRVHESKQIFLLSVPVAICLQIVYTSCHSMTSISHLLPSLDVPQEILLAFLHQQNVSHGIAM